MKSLTVISRKAALAAGLRHYFTGKPCKNGHVEVRFSACGVCAGCARIKSSRHYGNNKDSAAEKSKLWHSRNPDYADRNRDRINANSKRWRENNLPKCAALRSDGRARKLNATPGWFGEIDEFVVREAHSLAAAREDATGFKWEVDHSIPLAGRKVCGLHVAQNIQVIPMRDNRRKSNIFAVQ